MPRMQCQRVVRTLGTGATVNDALHPNIKSDLSA
jgi:hypothetical protein